jgi:cellulose synthase/poly-beta-1,6-N-acetylglucosamine synthase-like glycosyltransferase
VLSAPARSYLAERIPLDATITVIDNGGTDDTLRVANALAARTPRLRVLHLDAKGRGLALRRPWSRSEADIVAYMDVDLSTGLDALLPLVAPLISGHSDAAIGSRLAPGARIRSGCREDTTAEKVQIGAAEHLALEHLQPVDVTLHQS